MVVVLVVFETPSEPGRRQQRSVTSAQARGVVVDGPDAEAARDPVRAADDARPAVPGQRRAVAAMRHTSKPTAVVSHPDWCAPDRCGYLVPPVLAHMARRHRGPMHRVGDSRAGGQIVSYLISADALDPMVGVHLTCRAGNAWAELSVPQAAELVEQLHGLLAQVAGDPETDDE
ncbi:hypothetical protein [Micromonospora hortensis]|uniref:hypothetical protein n=1 Tax=Micromonospora hortensis TaxID=2911209 RepID=UPI001EE97F30|nr:hypothetical protein [Micromonospora hortensis]